VACSGCTSNSVFDPEKHQGEGAAFVASSSKKLIPKAACLRAFRWPLDRSRKGHPLLEAGYVDVEHIGQLFRGRPRFNAPHDHAVLLNNDDTVTLLCH